MGFSDDYYDILCGNDRRLIKIAVANDTFHTITIEADVARTIDFSGGTRKIDTIRLSKCFRASRFIWPERTGAIRRLFISNLDALAYLDITELDSLEELSIVNCKSLEEIRGIPASLKELNVHNCKLESLELSSAKNLQRINIITTMPSIKIDANGLKDLLAAYIATSKDLTEDSISTLNFNNCQCLYNLYIDCGDNNAIIDVGSCGILTNAYLQTGKLTRIKNLIDCKELDIFLNENAKVDEPAKFIVNKATKNRKRALEKMDEAIAFSQSFKDSVLNHKASVQDRETVIQQSGAKREFDHSRGVKISMLSVPEDLLRLVTEQDLRQVNRSIEFDSTGLFRNEPEKLVFHLQENAAIKNIDKLYPNALRFEPQSISPDQTIKEWLKGKNKPNILMLTEKDIRNPLVLKQLRYFVPMGRYWLYDGRRYKYRLYNRIFYYGDGYLLRNALPALAGLIAPLPFSALLYPSAPAAGFGRNATNRLAQQQMFNDMFRRELEMVRMYDHFLDYIDSQQQERHYHERLASMEGPGNPLHAGALSSNDLPNQTPVDGESNRSRNPFDDIPQTNIDGGSSGRQDPLDEQQPIDSDADSTGRNSPFDDQQNIDGDAHNPDKPNDDFDPQLNIDGGSDGPPDEMHGKNAPQQRINSNNKKKPLPNIDEQTPINASANKKPFDYDDQSLIDGKSKETPHDYDDQTGIDASADNRPHDYDDQVNIDAEAESNPELKDADPLSAEPAQQQPLAKHLHAKNLEAEPTNDQKYFDGSRKASDDLKDAPKVQTEPVNAQQLLKANQTKDAPKSTDPLNPDMTDEQQLLDIDKKLQAVAPLKPEATPAQTFFHANKKHKEINIPEQVAIEGSAESNPDHSHTLILENARKLALAMQKMTNEIKAPNQSQQVVAEVIIKLNEDLAKPLDKKSLYDAAVSLTQSLRALHDTCAAELTGKASLAKHKSKENARSDVKDERLLSQLETIYQNYAADNDLSTRTEGLFGYKAGVTSARSELLKTLIGCLRDKKQPNIKIDLIFHELKKDPAIRIAITAIEDELAKAIKPLPKKPIIDNT